MTRRAQLPQCVSVLAAILFGAGNVPAAELPAEWKNVQPLTVSQSGLVKISVPLETLTADRKSVV